MYIVSTWSCTLFNNYVYIVSSRIIIEIALSWALSVCAWKSVVCVDFFTSDEDLSANAKKKLIRLTACLSVSECLPACVCLPVCLACSLDCAHATLGKVFGCVTSILIVVACCISFSLRCSYMPLSQRRYNICFLIKPLQPVTIGQ